MIRVITGHLACGRWRLKKENGVVFMAHPQMFSRRNEFRIGPDQVVAVDVEKHLKKQIQVRILFSEERYCQALIDPSELSDLQSMVLSNEPPALAKDQTQTWVKGLFAFFVICIIFELIK